MWSREARIIRIAERQHAMFTGVQAMKCGFSQDAIDRRVRAGLWEREHQRVFRIRGAKRTYESDVMAAVLAGGRGALASHTVPLRLLGFDDLAEYPIHVTVPGRRHVRMRGVVLHRPVKLEKRDATRIGVIPVTSVARTLIDLAAVLSPSTLEDVIDEARRRDMINLWNLARRVDKLTPNGRRGVLLLRRLTRARVGKPVPGSKWEPRLADLLTARGLPAPVPQYEIFDDAGNFVARPDLVYPVERLYIEYESEEFHWSHSEREHDMERQNKLVALGYAPLRVSKKQMTDAPDRVCGQVSAALAAARAGFGAETVGGSRTG